MNEQVIYVLGEFTVIEAEVYSHYAMQCSKHHEKY